MWWSIDAKRNVLLEERELMLVMHHDNMRTMRARLKEATKMRVGGDCATTATTTRVAVGRGVRQKEGGGVCC